MYVPIRGDLRHLPPHVDLPQHHPLRSYVFCRLVGVSFFVLHLATPHALRSNLAIMVMVSCGDKLQGHWEVYRGREPGRDVIVLEEVQ